jgi:hypothetical protein
MRHGLGVRADGGHRCAQAAAQVEAALLAAFGRPSCEKTIKNQKEFGTVVSGPQIYFEPYHQHDDILSRIFNE